MGDPVRMGPEAKIDFWGVAYGAVDGTWEVLRDVAPSSDTESSSKESTDSPLRELHIDITANQDPATTYFGPPLALGARGGLPVRIWLNGRDDPVNVIDAPNMKVPSVRGGFRVEGNSPQQITTRLISSGDFSLPGE